MLQMPAADGAVDAAASTTLPLSPSAERPEPGRDATELTSLNWLQNITVPVLPALPDIDTNPPAPAPTATSSDTRKQPRASSSKQKPKKQDDTVDKPLVEQLDVAKLECKPPRKRSTQDTSGKPPYSFASLIFMAIEASASKCLPVKDVYTWIVAHFPYYRSAQQAWKNSVRHNLSLNKCFKKKGDDADCKSSSKGSLWIVHPESRDVLLQQVKRTGAIQAGLSRTVGNSKGFWADSLKGSGYCGDDESEVIEALCGIDDEDEERIQLRPRSKSCPPRLNDSTKIPSWMVKMRLSPYMAANTTRRIIRSNRVLYSGDASGDSSMPHDHSKTAGLPSTRGIARPSQLTRAAMTSSSSSNNCSSGGSSSSCNTSPVLGSSTSMRSSAAVCQPNGADEFDNDSDDADMPTLISDHRPPSKPAARHRAIDVRNTANSASPDEHSEEERNAANNLISLLNAAHVPESPDVQKKKRPRSKRKSQAAASSSASGRGEPKAKRLCEPPDEPTELQMPVANTSSHSRAKSNTAKQARYLEGVENGSVGVRRGSRKSIKSSESAFSNVAFKLPTKPKRKKSMEVVTLEVACEAEMPNTLGLNEEIVHVANGVAVLHADNIVDMDSLGALVQKSTYEEYDTEAVIMGVPSPSLYSKA